MLSAKVRGSNHRRGDGDVDRIGAEGTDISDLTGLEYATNLTELYLSDHAISDLSHCRD